ncbi:MAG TPA: YkgJ family cysteine cluster protein [Fluviicola sp.]|nr:YkgJ family cysteine cluster protein [Fluviicola sp.]
MVSTQLHPDDTLPLTCTRAGTCCHGNRVFLNPWELASLARGKQLTPAAFREQFCDAGGVVLRFDGPTNSNGKPACRLYSENTGCSVHPWRPLACRLYPLARQVQYETARYIYQGEAFPCLNECPDVVKLPHMRVREYLAGQQTDSFEKAQDEYLELMQDIADVAFTLLLDTGLAESGDTKTLVAWRKMGNEQPAILVKRIGQEWIDFLMIPSFPEQPDAIAFARMHNEQFQLKAQEEFGNPGNFHEIHEASVLMMALALYLARALGANPEVLADYWVEQAKSHGARE